MTGDAAAAPVTPGLPSADPVEVGWAELDALVARLAAIRNGISPAEIYPLPLEV